MDINWTCAQCFHLLASCVSFARFWIEANSCPAVSKGYTLDSVIVLRVRKLAFSLTRPILQAVQHFHSANLTDERAVNTVETIGQRVARCDVSFVSLASDFVKF